MLTSADCSSGSPKRTFPPLYSSTGDQITDKLAFVHILERLKTQRRTGWVNHKIPNPESISDHMYRMALLALISSDTTLNISKCVMMCLVHDLAEAQVGDISPHEGISKPEKKRLEEEAINNFVHDMLHDSPAAQRIHALWEEYEAGQTAEAKFVKDLDRFELASQALEYEKHYGTADLQPFFASSLPYIRHPEIKALRDQLLVEREALHNKEVVDVESE